MTENYQPSTTAPQEPAPEASLPQSEPTPPRRDSQEYQSPYHEEIILEWDAPSRPFKTRNKQYYTTVGLIVVLISLILLFAGQFLPIAVVIALAFLTYVLSSVPPEVVRNRITTHGIRNGDTLYHWEELGRFWFTTKYDQQLLHAEVSKIPNQITLVIQPELQDDLIEVLSEMLRFEKPPLTAFDKAANWLQEKIPLDTEA